MRPQAELPLYPCAPPFGVVGVGRCYAHSPVAGLLGTDLNVRVVTRLCPPHACPCELCLAGDAMVTRFEAA